METRTSDTERIEAWMNASGHNTAGWDMRAWWKQPRTKLTVLVPKRRVLDLCQHVRVFVMVAQTIETSNYVGTKMSGICCVYKCVRMPSDCRMFGIK